jgi:hypothetical protein
MLKREVATMTDVQFLYWARNPKGQTRNFILDTYYDIGQIIKHDGEWVKIYDVATEIVDMAQDEDF